jgi:hypothetical protein
MSKVLEIQETKRTPYVKFDLDNGTLEITGSILLVNPTNFFDEILEFADDYLLKPQDETNITLHIEYYNTYASKLLLFLLKKLQKLVKQDLIVKMTWLYEEDDEDMHEAGLTYKQSLKMQTTLKEVDE